MKIERDAPEYETVESFVAFLFDDERTTFLPGEAQVIAENIGRTTAEVVKILEDWGFKRSLNSPTKTVRGVNSNPNGTFPFAANPTFTTPGGDNICGFAGTAGR
jgi:hypothetical protein